MSKYKCVICKNIWYGFGNNPSPIKDNGKCCDSCNFNIVIPSRLKKLDSSKGV